MSIESRADTGTPRRVTAAVLLVVSIAVPILALTGVTSPFRTLVVVAFAVTAPGWALVAFWSPASVAMEWTLATALSVAILVVMSVAMVVLSAWAPVALFAVLAVVTAAVLVLHLLPARTARVTA